VKFRSAPLAAAMMALPLTVTNAQTIDGLYVGAGAGINILQPGSLRLRIPGTSATEAGNADHVGPAVLTSLGWGFGNGFRAEIEGNYRENATGGGTEQKAGAMANVLYDFVGLIPMVQPYVGGGAGYEWTIEQNLHGTGTGFAFSAPSGNRGGFAYQAIGGIAFPITTLPGLALTAEYRFVGLTGDRSYGAAVIPAAGPAVRGTLSSANDFNHSVLIGFRYAFGGAPAAVPAEMPLADAGAKTFLVFFDWNKYDLTARSQEIVRDAAGYSTHAGYTRIDVDGNTDTSGLPAYNQALSERRAQAVAIELVRDGVPENAISMHGNGDTKLLVATGQGVREPQNRRVEIVIH
jgi:OOP family OmpA-OmpF porin